MNEIKYKFCSYLGLTLALSSVSFTVLNQKTAANQNVQRIKSNSSSAVRIICDPMCREYGRPDAFKIISPVGTIFADDKTIKLAWTPVEKVQKYIVSLRSSQGTIWSMEVDSNKNEILYPQNRPPLQTGKKYNLAVKAVGEENKETEVGFLTLSKERTDKLKAEINKIRSQNILPQEKLIMIAELYEKERLISQADKSYQQALQVAKDRNDINNLAWVRVKLARMHLSVNNKKEALSLLKASHVNYNTLNNQKLSSQVAQFIGEIYSSINEQEQKAIRWYKIAKSGYESLNDKERLEVVERELNKLSRK